MMMARSGTPVGGVVVCTGVFILVAGCQFEKRDWTKAQAANTIEAYTVFLWKHPEGQFADMARKEVERQEWKLAVSSNTIDAFKAFSAKHPRSENVKEAKRAMDELERAAKLDSLLARHDIQALRAFVADDGNAHVLDRFKRAEGDTLTLGSQPDEAIKGYRLQVSRSKKNELHDMVIVIPSGAKVDVKSFGFSDGTRFKIAKGAVRIDIVNGKQAPGYAVGELKLAMTLKDRNVVKLASEYTDIAPDVMLHVGDSELAVTGAKEVTLRRDLGGKPAGAGGAKFLVTNGKLYLLKLGEAGPADTSTPSR